MFLTVHSTVGVFIGENLSNPAWAFLGGLFSHYLFDAIPHGDEKLNQLSLTKLSYLAVVDQAILLTNLLLLFHFKPDLTLNMVMIAAIIGSILPDWLTALHRLCENFTNVFARRLYRLLTPLQNFHLFIHIRLVPYEISLTLGLVLQIIFLAGLWTII